MAIGPCQILLVLTALVTTCDGAVGTSRALDACGACGGNNSTCQIISGLFTERFLDAGYRLVVQIPAGACSLVIEQLATTKNFLALRDSTGEFIVNGEWNIGPSGSYSGAGSTFLYRRQRGNSAEHISAPGPTTQPVDIYLLYRELNRGIQYQYAVRRDEFLGSVLPRLPEGVGSGRSQLSPPLTPASVNNRVLTSPPGQQEVVSNDVQRRIPDGSGGTNGSAPAGRGTSVEGSGKAGQRRRGRRRRRRRRGRGRRYQWVSTGLSQCSRSCGGGFQTNQVFCFARKWKRPVAEDKCNKLKRPTNQTLSCNAQPCPASWSASGWSACSATCGLGQQTRRYICTRESRRVEEAECTGGRSPPDDTRPCELAPCVTTTAAPAHWQVGLWSECSVSCGWGTRRRQVVCVGSAGRQHCRGEERPDQTAPCRRDPCPPPPQRDRSGAPAWLTTEWSETCSVDCGMGVQTRQLLCSGTDGSCDPETTPELTRPCKTDRHCHGMWFTGPWSKCSHQCGAGVMTRTVLCVRYSSGGYSVQPELACRGRARPARRRRCASPADLCPAGWYMSAWSGCSASCGPGWQSRTVSCLGPDQRPSAECPAADTPQQRRPCLLDHCPKQDGGSGHEYPVRVEWQDSPEPSVRVLHG